MIKAGYKETELGEIPEEWECSQVSKIFEVITGTTPPTRDKKYWAKGNIEWLTPTDLSKMNNGILISSGERKITELALAETPLKLIPKESILISTRAPVGYIAINLQKITFNQGCKGLVPRDKDKYSSYFYAYYLTLKVEFLKSLSAGSTFTELSKEKLENAIIPVPPFYEQQKIVKILLDTDDLISSLDELITKKENIKTGLMQELLTKGIGHTEFKDTEIGRIPKEWKVVKLVEVIKYVKGKKPKKLKLEYKDKYIPYLSTEYLRENKNAKFVDSLKNVILINEDDLILLWDGSNAGEIFLGRPGVLSSTMVRIQLKNNEYNKTFFYYLLKMNENYIKDRTKGTGIPHVDKVVLNNINIPILSPVEQKKIADILSDIQQEIEALEQKREKYKMIKSGLMQQLLTGKVRVK